MKVLHVLAQLPSRTGSVVYYTNIIEALRNTIMSKELFLDTRMSIPII